MLEHAANLGGLRSAIALCCVLAVGCAGTPPTETNKAGEVAHPAETAAPVASAPTGVPDSENSVEPPVSEAAGCAACIDCTACITAPSASTAPASTAPPASTASGSAPVSPAAPVVPASPAPSVPATQATRPPTAVPSPRTTVAKAPIDNRSPSQAVAPAPPATVATTPVPSVAPKTVPTPVTTEPPAAPLDLKSLETRLRQTKAIGVLTKLSLKNQVDDLLESFARITSGRRRRRSPSCAGHTRCCCSRRCRCCRMPTRRSRATSSSRRRPSGASSRTPRNSVNPISWQEQYSEQTYERGNLCSCCVSDGVLATTLEAQESSGTDTKDLTAVIALQGLPCGQVVSASKQGDDDYVVSCQDGNRYRVVVNKDGRVVVEKR